MAADHTGVPLRSRILGLGSVYAKTLRDSRRAILISVALLGGLMLFVGASIPNVYATPESRKAMADLAKELPPIGAGFTGKPLNVGTIGGYMTWKYGPVFTAIACLWSILALSGTLATEARRGSLEIVAASPFGRRRLAIEKLAAHMTGMVVAVAVFGLAAWLAGTVFGKLPGDAIPPQAAIGYAAWLALVAFASGSVAWALAPLFGRASAAGVAGVILLVGYALNGYANAFPQLAGVDNITWFGWTANHNPLCGQYDWVSLIPVAIVSVLLFAAGIELFARRDLGSASAIPAPSLPNALLGLRGLIGRSFGERFPVAVAWGLGIGFFGLGIASISPALADGFAKMSPDNSKIFRDVFPNFDMTTAAGGLQLVFLQLGFIIVGFAAATLVAGWASDETSRRLEMVLSTPTTRVRWTVESAAGLMLAEVAMTVVIAIGVGIGAVAAGSDPLTPMAGTATMALYAMALTGVGIAIAGLFRASIAAEVVAAIVAATALTDLIGPAMRLPEWFHSLALTSHLGQPMVGIWDPAGAAACLGIAAVGVLLGSVGMNRRDVTR